MTQSSFQNKLIRKLTGSDFDGLRDHFERVDMNVRDVLIKPKQPVTDVYFPENGQISILAKVPNSEPIEVGMVGCEGMTELAPSGRTPLESMCQIAGSAHRIDREKLLALVRTSGDFADLMLRYQSYASIQASYNALSHGSFTLAERLARWLLMYQDRIGDEIPLSHDIFSRMLSVRRVGVTEAFKALRSKGCIETTRGKVVILDRDMLIELASGSYGVAEAEYQRLLG